MAVEKYQTTVRRYYEEVKNQGKLESLEQLVDPNYIEHNPLPGQGQGLAGLRQRAEMLQRAFRARITVEDMIADGDKVVVRLANYLVHEGTFLGIPATGKSATIQGIAIHRIRGGKIAERWILIDTAALLQQLGAIPQPNATTA